MGIYRGIEQLPFFFPECVEFKDGMCQRTIEFYGLPVPCVCDGMTGRCEAQNPIYSNLWHRHPKYRASLSYRQLQRFAEFVERECEVSIKKNQSKPDLRRDIMKSIRHQLLFNSKLEKVEMRYGTITYYRNKTVVTSECILRERLLEDYMKDMRKVLDDTFGKNECGMNYDKYSGELTVWKDGAVIFRVKSDILERETPLSMDKAMVMDIQSQMIEQVMTVMDAMKVKA